MAVAVPGPTLELIKTDLGGEAEGILFLDMTAAFEGPAVTILRPYDEVRLEVEVIADAKVAHPTVISGDGRESASDVYDWQAVVDRYNQALAPARDAAAFSYGGEDLPAVRRFALAQAMPLGLAGERLMDVELAVAELSTNSVVHGGGCGTLAIWADQGQLGV